MSFVYILSIKLIVVIVLIAIKLWFNFRSVSFTLHFYIFFVFLNVSDLSCTEDNGI